MTNQKKLKDLLKQRATPPQREAVKPVNLYTNPQVDKDTEYNKSIQVNKTTKPLVSKSVSKQTSKEVKPLIVKYTTHLTKDLIKAIKQKALDTDKKDYEVVREAIEEYIKKRGDTP
jgi:hypothetical protein